MLTSVASRLFPLLSSTLTVSYQILVAGATTFEEFVDEQLREDGSGQVLRREGGTGLLVPSRKTLSQAFIVAPGCCLCWEFRVKVRRGKDAALLCNIIPFAREMHLNGKLFRASCCRGRSKANAALVFGVRSNSLPPYCNGITTSSRVTCTS